MNDAPTDQPIRWIKSTRSAGGGECVEMTILPGGVAVRDSKDPDGPRLFFSQDSWRAFIAGVRSGAFD